MKNISSYLILSLLLSSKAYALTGKDFVKISFSNFQPEITADGYVSVSGFSALSSDNLDVTYNDKAEINKVDAIRAEISSFPKGTVDKSPKIREATIDEPLVINDWAVTVGADVKMPTSKKELNDIKHSQSTNTEKKEIVVTESEYREDSADINTNFQLNDIEKQKEEFIEDDGIGVLDIASSTNTIKEDSQQKNTIHNLSEDESSIVPLKIKEESSTDKAIKQKTKAQDKSSIWAVATVRGQPSNRFASIGSDKDISKYFPQKGIVSQSDMLSKSTIKSTSNPWAITPNESISQNTSQFSNISDKYSYTPDTKINQWAIREMKNDGPSFSDTSAFEFTSDQIKTDYNFDDRWINEEKAVLINSISSKPITKKNQQTETLQHDEKSDVPKNTSKHPRQLLTKIDEHNDEITSSSTNFQNTDANKKISDFHAKSEDSIKTPSHINLNEVRLNFKSGTADLSMPSIRVVSNFANRVADNKNIMIEIRVSDRLVYLQSKRIVIVKRILQANGIDSSRIISVTTDRDIDTMIIRSIPPDPSKQVIPDKQKIKERIKKW